MLEHLFLGPISLVVLRALSVIYTLIPMRLYYAEWLLMCAGIVLFLFGGFLGRAGQRAYGPSGSGFGVGNEGMGQNDGRFSGGVTSGGDSSGGYGGNRT